MTIQRGYIGTGGIYATLRLPERVRKDAAGVLLCPPFGEERRCALRMMVRLAERLAEAGLPTMTFDLSGTGDSAGAHADMTWPQWERDTLDAAHVLLEESGVSGLQLVGFRSGAFLAAAAALRLPATRRLTVVEPFLSGSELLKELERRERIKRTTGQIAGDCNGGLREYGGFPVGGAMQASLEDVDLMGIIREIPGEVFLHVIRVSGMSSFPKSWEELVARATGNGRAEIIRDKPFWGQVDYFESDAIPDAIVTA